MEPLCSRQEGGREGGGIIFISVRFLEINLSVSPSEQVEPGEAGGVKHSAQLSQQTLLPPSGCLRQDEISEPEKYPAGTKRQEGEGGRGDTYYYNTYKGGEN